MASNTTDCMVRISFYDPSEIHKQSYFDKDIRFISSLDHLRQSIINNNSVQHVLCICGPEKSVVINEVQPYQQVKAVYWCGCAEHGGRYDNSLPNGEKLEELIIKPCNGWELICRSKAIEICIQGGFHKQALIELNKLTKIGQKILSLLQASATTAALLSNQLNGLNMDRVSQDATDIE